MNTVQVKNTVIGEGRPKICVPIVGKTKTDILEEAKKITTLPVDVVEWRVDWFDDVFATEKVLETAKELQEVLKDIPVLLTFRTSKEGGEKEISVNDYAALNIAAAQSGYVDLIEMCIRDSCRAVYQAYIRRMYRLRMQQDLKLRSSEYLRLRMLLHLWKHLRMYPEG